MGLVGAVAAGAPLRGVGLCARTGHIADPPPPPPAPRLPPAGPACRPWRSCLAPPMWLLTCPRCGHLAAAACATSLLGRQRRDFCVCARTPQHLPLFTAAPPSPFPRQVTLSAALAGSGFEPGRRTLFTCEGLIYYLPEVGLQAAGLCVLVVCVGGRMHAQGGHPMGKAGSNPAPPTPPRRLPPRPCLQAACATLLGSVADLAAPGSRLLFDFLHQDAQDGTAYYAGYQACALVRWVGWTGWGWSARAQPPPPAAARPARRCNAQPLLTRPTPFPFPPTPSQSVAGKDEAFLSGLSPDPEDMAAYLSPLGWRLDRCAAARGAPRGREASLCRLGPLRSCAQPDPAASRPHCIYPLPCAGC